MNSTPRRTLRRIVSGTAILAIISLAVVLPENVIRDDDQVDVW